MSNADLGYEARFDNEINDNKINDSLDKLTVRSYTVNKFSITMLAAVEWLYLAACSMTQVIFLATTFLLMPSVALSAPDLLTTNSKIRGASESIVLVHNVYNARYMRGSVEANYSAEGYRKLPSAQWGNSSVLSAKIDTDYRL